MYYELIFLGIASIGAPYLAKAAGYKNGLMPFKMLGLAGFFFLMSAGVGMGMTLVDAASDKDIPLAVGALVFTGIFVLLAHLAVDILYSYLDPRIRY